MKGARQSKPGTMSAIKDAHIVKIAVEMDEQVPQLIEFDQQRPLTAIIQDLCNTWALAEPEQYSLQFSDNARSYITEKNRNDIKNGYVLRLTHSPAKTAQDILDKLHSNKPDDMRAALERLQRLSSDYTFALEFINKQGHQLLINMVEAGTYTGDHLALTLQSFVELMDHGIVFWDILEPKFVGRVANQVNVNTTQDTRTLQASLSILESLVLNGTGRYAMVDQEVTLPNLIMHMQSSAVEIQQSAVALINALFLKAESTTKRKTLAATLSSRHIRNVIVTAVLQRSQQHVGTEMAHQLYVLQTLLLNLLEERRVGVDPNDAEARERILELRRIAFDVEADGTCSTTSGGRKGGGYAKDYKKLGFQNHTNPIEDFSEPPGILALDNMVYFARNHTESYTKFVLENSCRADEHECPFGRSSIRLTRLLAEILKVGEPPTEQGKTYYPMFFTHDHPFEEFFCIGIMLLNKTWKEMRATTEDFIKVFSVVQEQISRALATEPPLMSLDKFRSKLATLTYSEIMNLWQQEQSTREEWESQAKPIIELREQVTPEIMDLIQQQRLQFLCEGTLFTKYSAKGHRIKDKFWYCRLSPSQKVFHYGDCEENAMPSLEELPHKLPVIEIRSLATGRECPYMKDTRKAKSTASLAFSLIPDSNQEPLNFVASNEKIFDYWTDGINALLGKKMVSKETKNDLETLLSMEIKLRLMDTEGVDIPESPPPIPKEPPNFDFCYEFK
ncbi:engulfment and cell motility protein 1 [Dermacentor andersoni]|uniref:engulfment and cell motility protein 1 n=1 Tax=Dermacentor andersoni TaxID=34620 RepID=UPI002155C89E|nr:engulfment and cell motility protein 1-like [Dermacentor andersoni]